MNDFASGRASIIFPRGGSRARAYLAYSVADGVRLEGDKDVQRFVEACVETGMPREYFDGARAAGPLATFEGADSWVEHPYRDGVALIGDAATSSDPEWGQGLALTLRDARVLRDALSTHEDWDAAGRTYATEHDRYYNVVPQSRIGSPSSSTSPGRKRMNAARRHSRSSRKTRRACPTPRPAGLIISSTT